MKGSVLLALLLVHCLAFVCLSQQFSVFKSYKDAKVKPKNYGRKIQREHAVEEYLDETQLKMLRARKSAVADPADVMTDQWSGFEVNKKLRKRSGAAPREAVAERFQTERRLGAAPSSWLELVQRRTSLFFVNRAELNGSFGGSWATGVFVALAFAFCSLSLAVAVLLAIAACLYRAKELDELGHRASVGATASDMLLKDFSASEKATS